MGGRGTTLMAMGTSTELAGDKAERIVEAMRISVARRGAAGSTFDHVAREAGVSRGLLHYYFGTKEKLLGEVVRRECAMRMDLLQAALGEAKTAEDLLAILVSQLEESLEDDGDIFTLIFELFAVSRRNEEVREEFAELYRQVRRHVGDVLDQQHAAGVVRLAGPGAAVASALFALADGLALQMLSDPETDFGPSMEAAKAAAWALLDAPSVT